MPKAKVKLTGGEVKKLDLACELSNCKVSSVRKIAGEVQAIISGRSSESLVDFGKYLVGVNEADLAAFTSEKTIEKKEAKK